MKKLLFIPILFILLLSFVSATSIYESVSSYQDDIYTCDTNSNGGYEMIKGKIISVDENLTDTGLLYASASIDYIMSQYIYNSTTSVVYYIRADGTDHWLRSLGASNTPLNTSEIDDIEIVGDYLYTYYNEDHILKKYSIDIITTGTTILGEPTSIYINPTINGTSIHYIEDQNNLYIYDPENYKLYISDLTGSYKGYYDVNISNDDISNICYTDTWYMIDKTSDTLYKMTDTKPLGTFEYINGEYWANQNCIDTTSLCTATIYVQNGDEIEYWCDIDDTIYCDALCETSVETFEGVNVNIGYCGVATCESECSFNGYQECLSPTSYRECGQFDSDICLEYAPETECLENFYCSSTGFCAEYNFSSVSATSSLVDLPSFYLKPYITTDSLTSISKDLNDVYQISTEYNVYTQSATYLSPLTNQDFYNAYVCDYDETSIYSDDDTYTNDSFSIEINANSEYSTTKFNLDLNGSNNVNISVTDSVNSLAQLTFIYNATNYNLLVYRHILTDPLGQLLINDTGYKSYDDLDSIDVTITDKPDTKHFDLYIYLNRYTPIAYQSVLIDYYSTSNTGYTHLDLESENNVIIEDLSVVYVLTRPIYDSLTLGSYTEIVCSYTSTGCYTIRSYAMGVDYALYNNYEDIELCVNSLSSTLISSSQSETMGEELASYSLSTRLLLLLFVVGITAVVFFVVGDNDNGIKKAIGVGLIAVELILFVVVGLIPAWILLLMFSIVAIWVTGFMRKIFWGE